MYNILMNANGSTVMQHNFVINLPYLFACCLFNDTASSSDCIMSGDS